ncbi:MAG: Lrp/AsnC family transcriptional regulator [Candidatus Eiseniibacteriota bacterium]|jgi:DNA-binding Lrp family transcriptional regulator
MQTAYILISCDPEDTEEIVLALRNIKEISEAKMVEGPYDIIAKLEANDSEKVKEIISTQLKKIIKIKHTLTLTSIQN